MAKPTVDFCPVCKDYDLLLVTGCGRRLCSRCLTRFTYRDIVAAEKIYRGEHVIRLHQ